MFRRFIQFDAAMSRGYLAPAGDEGSTDGEGSLEATLPESDSEQKAAKEPDGDRKERSEEEARLLKESMARKAKLKEAEAEKAQLLERLNEMESKFGSIDLDKYNAMLEQQSKAEEERRKAEEEKLAAEGNWEKLKERIVSENGREKQQIIEAHQRELSERELLIEESRKNIEALQSQVNELTVGSAFANSSFVAEKLVPSANKVRKLYGEHFESENGKAVGYDKPRGADGRTKLVDGSGNPLPFETALMRIVDADDDRDTILRSFKKPGAGSTTQAPTGGETKIGSGVDRISYALNKQQGS